MKLSKEQRKANRLNADKSYKAWCENKRDAYYDDKETQEKIADADALEDKGVDYER